MLTNLGTARPNSHLFHDPLPIDVHVELVKLDLVVLWVNVHRLGVGLQQGLVSRFVMSMDLHGKDKNIEFYEYYPKIDRKRILKQGSIFVWHSNAS